MDELAKMISGSGLSAADTAWMLGACALVLLMTPALAFFYGGLVRSKNVLNTMMMSFASLGAVGLCWALFGYSGEGAILILPSAEQQDALSVIRPVLETPAGGKA